MGMREKLIEILAEINCNDEYCKDCEFYNDNDGCIRRQKEIIADYLIANGVTIPVRCKECKKRYNPNECPMCILAYGELYEFTHDGGYCDRGERRADDGETG